jgi:uncharacterized membrane protein YhaH (DUF805 family)
MIQRWFDPRGAIPRSQFLVDTAVIWLLGNLGVIAFCAAMALPFSFAGLGVLLDHRGQTLSAIRQGAGTHWAALNLALWLAQAWMLAALSSKRLHDLGRSGWYAILSLVPGIQVLFWLALCVWPPSNPVRMQAA